MAGPTPRRKWLHHYGGLLFVFLLGVVLVRYDPTVPAFRRETKPQQDFTEIFYPFAHANPFAGGLTWVGSRGGTNGVNYWVVDVEQGRTLGELSNIAPLFIDGNTRRFFGIR